MDEQIWNTIRLRRCDDVDTIYYYCCTKASLQDYEGCCGSCVDLKWLIWQQPGQQLAADIAVSSRAEAVFGDHVTFLTNLSQEIAGCSYEHSVLSAEKHSEATSRRRCSPKKKNG